MILIITLLRTILTLKCKKGRILVCALNRTLASPKFFGINRNFGEPFKPPIHKSQIFYRAVAIASASARPNSLLQFLRTAPPAISSNGNLA